MNLGKYIYKDDNLYDENGNAVMMMWEKEWMEESADIVCKNGGDILNVGHGLGLVDTFINQHNIKSHTIVESHEDVLKYMRDNGWYEKSIVVEGRWQHVINDLPTFDGIYFDTFAEYGKDFVNGFIRKLPSLLNKGGIFTQWVNTNDKNPHLEEFCVNNNLELTYKEYTVNVPKEQHVSGGEYISHKLSQVLLPIIKNLNDPIKIKKSII
jgi:hypothetical protein